MDGRRAYIGNMGIFFVEVVQFIFLTYLQDEVFILSL